MFIRLTKTIGLLCGGTIDIVKKMPKFWYPLGGGLFAQVEKRKKECVVSIKKSTRPSDVKGGQAVRPKTLVSLCESQLMALVGLKTYLLADLKRVGKEQTCPNNSNNNNNNNNEDNTTSTTTTTTTTTTKKLHRPDSFFWSQRALPTPSIPPGAKADERATMSAPESYANERGVTTSSLTGPNMSSAGASSATHVAPLAPPPLPTQVVSPCAQTVATKDAIAVAPPTTTHATSSVPPTIHAMSLAPPPTTRAMTLDPSMATHAASACAQTASAKDATCLAPPLSTHPDFYSSKGADPKSADAWNESMQEFDSMLSEWVTDMRGRGKKRKGTTKVKGDAGAAGKRNKKGCCRHCGLKSQ